MMARVLAMHWAIEPGVFDQLRAIIERHDAGERLTGEQLRSAIGRAPSIPNPRDRKYDIHQGTALIPVSGVIAKHASAVQDVSQPTGTSAEEIQADLAMALADPTVSSILLHVESPGGSVDGTAETALAVAAAAAQKPTWSFIDGVGASAAYWIASAASRVIATPSSMVGSIGVLGAVRDSSGAAEKAGIRTHVIRSAPLKGGAVAGAPVSDGMIAEQQRLVDGLARIFGDAVSANRGLVGDRLAAVTDGRVHLAAEAKGLGLIDAVGSFQDALQGITDPTQAKRRARPIMVQAQGRQGAITAYTDLAAKLKAAGDSNAYRTIAVKHPEVHGAYVAAVNTKPISGGIR